MEMKKNSKLLTVYLYIFLFIVNIIPLVIFREQARITIYSSIPLLMIADVIISTVATYKLGYRKWKLYNAYKTVCGINPHDKKDYTDTPGYKKYLDFMFSMTIGTIPFFIPAVFFAKNGFWAILWLAAVILLFGLPNLVLEIRGTFKIAKANKKVSEQRAEELKEQIMREELGKWK